MPDLPPGTATDLVIIGAGPKTTGVLLALAATEDAGAGLDIHLVDPFPPGAGRIWRTAQSPHLWMNSRTEDITIFPDETCRLSRTPVPGPDLHAWVHGPGRDRLCTAGLGEEVLALGPRSFPSRRVQGHYLEWAFAEALDRLAARVHVHRARVESARRLPEGDYRVLTSEGVIVRTRVLVSAQGHLDMAPAEVDAEFARAVAFRAGVPVSAGESPDGGSSPAAAPGAPRAPRRSGLHYQGPGFTADLDFDAIPGGADVLTRGFGLAFVDLMVMLTQGRGGEFVECEGRLRYRASGREPVLWVGSSRGVAYSPKLGYSRADIPGAPAVELRYVDRLGGNDAARDPATGDLGGDTPIDFATTIGPLAELELTHAHCAHVLWKRGIDAGALLETIDAGADRIRAGSATPARVRETIAEAAAEVIADPADRFDLAAIDRPLAELRVGSLGEVEDRVRTHLAAALDRSADPDRSADLAVFEALIKVYVAIRGFVRAGRVSARDRTEFVEDSFHSLFSFIGSGPPPERIRQMLALHEAGLLRFLGPGLAVTAGEHGFRARSSAHSEGRDFTYFVDARLATQSAARALDPALSSLRAAGAVRLEDDGGAAKLLTDGTSRAIDSAGRAQPGLFLLGPAVSGATAEAFSRPRTNAPVFADNERIASAIIDAVETAGAGGTRRTAGRVSMLAG